MYMLTIGASAKEDHIFVVFDVGSASIGAAIAIPSPHGMAVVWDTRVEYGYRSDDDFERYARTMYATLLEVGMKVSGEGFKEVRAKVPKFRVKDVAVHCIMTPPWFFGVAYTERKNKEQPFQLSSALVAKMQEDGVSRIMDTMETFSLWKDVMGGDTVLFELYLESIRLEGYRVSQFTHRHTRDLTVQSYVALMDASVQGHIEEVLEKVFPNFPNTIHSSTHLFSNLWKGTSEKRTCIELHGEMTTVTYIKNGCIEGTTTVPVGTNHLLREIAPKAMNAKEARAPLEVLLRGGSKLPTDFSALSEELQEPLRTWHRRVSEVLLQLLEGITPPKQVTLIARELWYPLFSLAFQMPVSIPGTESDFQLVLDEQVSNMHKKVAKNTHIDTRLSTVSTLLADYVGKKGV